MKTDNGEIRRVMVHPDLQNDPVSMQGQVGFVSTANMGTDDYWVVFDHDEIGLYAADALLVVKEGQQIREYISQNAETLSPEEVRSLEYISDLHKYGNEDKKKRALDYVQAFPQLRDGALATIESYREPSRSQEPER